MEDYEYYHTEEYQTAYEENEKYKQWLDEPDPLINKPLTYEELYDRMSWFLDFTPEEKYRRKVWKWYRSQFHNKRR